MVRQDTAPIDFGTTLRPENDSKVVTIDPGVVAPVVAFPMFRGDSASGRVDLNIQLAEMPKPLENAVIARGQIWVVPRPALPQFSGLTDYTHSYQGKSITALGQADRTPPALFSTVSTGAIAAANTSEFFETLGIYLVDTTEINTDYIDAYNLIQNFRLAAHSSKLTRYDYYAEDATTSLELKPAFWPRNRMHDVVPDYERALVVGALELDVTAGSIPVNGIGIANTASSESVAAIKYTGGTGSEAATAFRIDGATTAKTAWIDEDPDNAGFPGIFAEMSELPNGIVTSLADIDKARTTNAFAKRVAAMRGSDYSGFNNDDVLVAELMRGFTVPDELFNRPWLVDSKTTVFGMLERHSTTAGSQDESVSTGQAVISLSVNIPKQNYGAVVIGTVEVMPERLYERASDEYLYVTDVEDLPDPLRDSQRTEPVDNVLNRRLDAAHTTPEGLYGYEPMNAKWRRDFTRLGGEYRQMTPGTPTDTARTSIWQADYVDPQFTSDQFLCPHPFPKDIFSVPSAHAVNMSVVQRVTIAGQTIFGEMLVEDSGDFDDVSDA
jgi:hypothetical protein